MNNIQTEFPERLISTKRHAQGGNEKFSFDSSKGALD